LDNKALSTLAAYIMKNERVDFSWRGWLPHRSQSQKKTFLAMWDQEVYQIQGGQSPGTVKTPDLSLTLHYTPTDVALPTSCTYYCQSQQYIRNGTAYSTYLQLFNKRQNYENWLHRAL